MAGTRGPVPVPLQANGTPDLTISILHSLEAKQPLDTAEDFPGASQAEVKAALDRLASRSMVEYETNDVIHVVLTEEGQQICDEGSHEWKVWEAVKSKGRIPIKDLEKVVGPSAKVGQGNAFKAKWIKKEGDVLVPIAKDVTDTTRELLRRVSESGTFPDPKQFKEYQKRTLVTTRKLITYAVRKGAKWALEMPVEVTVPTAEMLQDGSWKTANFKPINFSAPPPRQKCGALHPLNKVRDEFRNIFFARGFIEMPTARYVDSAFWNFDALFVPQQHPARDLQDTFYVSDPPEAGPPGPDSAADAALDEMEADSQTTTSTSKLDYDQYYKNVKAVHQDGAFGSIGYRYPYSDAETRRLVLRTHTTAVSAYCLHRLALDPRPARYFSIDRVFRNEKVDATHLAEFHQVEGVIADYGLTLGGLMDWLGKFFAKLGISNLRFKPAYNPYTEPSMEIFGYHKGLGKWVEIGNSGMFRPEMLLAMGLPEGLRCYGFGLSLERPTMIMYGISNIRELLGHKVDLEFIRTSQAVRL
jgi:phenylalanyl-tRNA synthetase alpha chain